MVEANWRVADTFLKGWPCLIGAMAYVPDSGNLRFPTGGSGSAGTWKLDRSRLRQNPTEPAVIEIRIRRHASDRAEGTNHVRNDACSTRANGPRPSRNEGRPRSPFSPSQHEGRTKDARICNQLRSGAPNVELG